MRTADICLLTATVLVGQGAGSLQFDALREVAQRAGGLPLSLQVAAWLIVAAVILKSALFCLSCLAISLLGSTAGARPFDVIGGDWEGCADLVRQARDDLGDGRVRAVERLDLSSLRPIDSVLILHPEKTLDALMRTPLADATLPFRHYSAERLWSDEARAKFVEPDLRPLPAPHG